MAASDPTPYVATPTGTLQGVAAFSWDGSAWQPFGRAGPDVATPTGVLQGVAAFNGGPAWQPTGSAQPSVATPTGVLDGVAVYTWSGSAWTPASGTATPSTPSGALRGVAAFNWDGTAWQPAGQARPSVPTPYGVLDGVAMFGWTGSAWAAVGAPSLSLDFTSGALDPRITFTRASTATYFNSAGVMQTAATNAPRFDYDPVTHVLRGLLIEEARTNLCTSSAVNGPGWAVSNITLAGSPVIAPDGTAGFVRIVEMAVNSFHTNLLSVTIPASSTCTYSAYAQAGEVRYLQLGFDNSGAIGLYATFDLVAGVVSGPLAAGGGATAVSASMQLVGNGIYRCVMVGSLAATTTARASISLSITPNPGAFSGYLGNTANGLLVWGVQIEQGAFPTSYIQTTGVTVTRAQDQCSVSSANMGWFVGLGGSWMAEFICLTPSPPNASIIGQAGAVASGGITPLFLGSTFNGSQYDGANSVGTPTLTALNTIGRLASTWTAGQAKAVMNGGGVGSSALLSTGYAALASSGISFLSIATPGTITGMTGYIRRVRYWPRVLSDAEMQAVTT